MPPSSIIAAATVPVSSEICAFQSSQGSGVRYARPYVSPTVTTSWSGRSRLMEPRARATREPAFADLSEQHVRRLVRAGVDGSLDGRVVQLRHAAHRRPAQVRRPDLAVAVERDGPHEGRTLDALEQRGGVLRQHRRVQRRTAVRGVEGLDPSVRLAVDRPSGPDEGRQVGDGVADDEAARLLGQVHRLVEIGGSRRVEGHERKVGQVLPAAVQRRAQVTGGRLGLGEHGRVEGLRDLELGAQPVEGRTERRTVGHEPEVAARHPRSLRRRCLLSRHRTAVEGVQACGRTPRRPGVRRRPPPRAAPRSASDRGPAASGRPGRPGRWRAGPSPSPARPSRLRAWLRQQRAGRAGRPRPRRAAGGPRRRWVRTPRTRAGRPARRPALGPAVTFACAVRCQAPRCSAAATRARLRRGMTIAATATPTAMSSSSSQR